MKRLLVFIFISIFYCLCSSVPAQDIVLRGSVNYTVETARKMAFDGLDLKLDKKFIEPYAIDENNKENRDYIDKKKQPEGRMVMSFVMARGLVKGYAIVYDDKPEYVFYYTNGGYLIAIDIDKIQDKNTFPYKIGKYSAATGNLVSIGFYVSDEEQYVYTKNGKLKAHWVGNTAYNEKGRPIATRDVSGEIPFD